MNSELVAATAKSNSLFEFRQSMLWVEASVTSEDDKYPFIRQLFGWDLAFLF